MSEEFDKLVRTLDVERKIAEEMAAMKARGVKRPTKAAAIEAVANSKLTRHMIRRALESRKTGK